MTLLDFFSGIGRFNKGMEQQGHECIGHCEVDKYAEMSYRSMHCITDIQRTYLNGMPLKDRQKEIMKEEYLNGEWFSNDIRSVRAGDIPRADCWCFGFPCQDISIAGKTVGFNGSRSSLFFTVTGLIKDIKEEDRPTTLFIENVKNLLSVNHGFDFAKLLVEVDEIGYDAEWSVENSKFYGVPQNRERCFIIGHLRGHSRREVFPIGCVSAEDTQLQGHEDRNIVNTLTTRTGTADSVGTYIATDRQTDRQVIKVNGYHKISPKDVKCVNTKNDLGNHTPQQDRIYRTDGISPALCRGKSDLNIIQVGQMYGTDKEPNPMAGRIYDPDGISPCLDTCSGGNRMPKITIKGRSNGENKD